MTRKIRAQMAAPSIWKGPGMRPQNIPAATAPAAEWRLRCQSRGCSSDDSKGRNQRLSRMAAWSGRSFRKCLRMLCIIQETGGDGAPTQGRRVPIRLPLPGRAGPAWSERCGPRRWQGEGGA